MPQKCLYFFNVYSIIYFAIALERCKMNIGVSPSGKATDSDSVIRWFKSSYPSHFGIIRTSS